MLAHPTYTRGQTVWIAFSLQKRQGIVSHVIDGTRLSQAQIVLQDGSVYPDNMVFGHEPKLVTLSDDMGTFTSWQ